MSPLSLDRPGWTISDTPSSELVSAVYTDRNARNQRSVLWLTNRPCGVGDERTTRSRMTRTRFAHSLLTMTGGSELDGERRFPGIL